MNILFQKWWSRETRQFSIINYKKAWKEVGNSPRIKLFHNGARKKSGDTCRDVTLIIGYTIFNYTNFALQGR